LHWRGIAFEPSCNNINIPGASGANEPEQLVILNQSISFHFSQDMTGGHRCSVRDLPNSRLSESLLQLANAGVPCVSLRCHGRRALPEKLAEALQQADPSSLK
jgi:hypothetical protein